MRLKNWKKKKIWKEWIQYKVFLQVSPNFYKQNYSKDVPPDTVPKKGIYIFFHYLGILPKGYCQIEKSQLYKKNDPWHSNNLPLLFRYIVINY